jgi:hypothetical protein
LKRAKLFAQTIRHEVYKLKKERKKNLNIMKKIY